MFLGNLALTALLTQASPDATPPDSAQYPDTVNAADTLPAIQLTDVPYFIKDTSGMDRSQLDSCYALLRTLLEMTMQKGWRGEFNYDALVKRYPKLKQEPTFQPASFLLYPGRSAVYVTFMGNDGYLPTICLVNDFDAGLLEFSYTTSQGTSVAWVAPISAK